MENFQHRCKYRKKGRLTLVCLFLMLLVQQPVPVYARPDASPEDIAGNVSAGSESAKTPDKHLNVPFKNVIASDINLDTNSLSGDPKCIPAEDGGDLECIPAENGGDPEYIPAEDGEYSWPAEISRVMKNSLRKSRGQTPEVVFLAKKLKGAAEIKSEELRQKPELPTGCESVSLTIVLRDLGFKLEKTDISEKYMIYEKKNMAEGYIGSPKSTAGAGVFTPGLAKTAEKYLETVNSDLKVYNLYGTELDELLKLTDAGYEVIVWTTEGMGAVEFAGGTYKHEDQVYRWYTREHCAVICGYDLKKKMILINDPVDGKVKRNLDAFRRIHDEIGRFAMVIM